MSVEPKNIRDTIFIVISVEDVSHCSPKFIYHCYNFSLRFALIANIINFHSSTCRLLFLLLQICPAVQPGNQRGRYWKIIDNVSFGSGNPRISQVDGFNMTEILLISTKRSRSSTREYEILHLHRSDPCTRPTFIGNLAKWKPEILLTQIQKLRKERNFVLNEIKAKKVVQLL